MRMRALEQPAANEPAGADAEWWLGARGPETEADEPLERINGSPSFAAMLGDRYRDSRRAREQEAVSGPATEPVGEVADNPLGVRWLAEIAVEVDQAPPVGWLARPVWPADAYGVLSAEKKAGKTWLALDLAVSVASGTPWLGRFPVERPGTVLVFLGEGGQRKMLRRLRAIAGGRGLDAAALLVRVAFRVPQLGSSAHLAHLAAELAANAPRLVVVDPLYLAAGGAKGNDLYAMGALLGGVQGACQDAGAALSVITHHNKGGEGNGSHRMTGVGPAEWGRVLVSAGVEHRQTNPDRSTVVTLRVLVEGDEIPETDLRVRRWVGAADPDDLSSPLNYRVEVYDAAGDEPPAADQMRPATRRVLAVLEAAGDWLTVGEIGDALALDDTGMRPLKARTIQAACKDLVDAGTVVAASLDGTNAHKWRTAHAERAQPVPEEVENAF